jgi:hypothetical protein
VALDGTKSLHVQFRISDTPHADRYAKDSLDSDDAAQVLLRISGTNKDGEEFATMAAAGGQQAVGQMNALYDILVGRNVAESCTSPTF